MAGVVIGFRHALLGSEADWGVMGLSLGVSVVLFVFWAADLPADGKPLRGRHLMKPILEIQDVSKQYKLGGKRIQRTENFRELLQRAASAPFRALAGRTSDGVAKEDLYTFWALHHVSFDVKQGDVLGIIGRNGAGKSTMLKILSRITSPTSGTVTIRGRWPACWKSGPDFIRSSPDARTFF